MAAVRGLLGCFLLQKTHRDVKKHGLETWATGKRSIIIIIMADVAITEVAVTARRVCRRRTDVFERVQLRS